MTARISTQHGVYKGKTVESIIRRVYGQKATLRYSADRNSPEVGLVVTPAYKNAGVYNVEAKVQWIEGDHEAETVPDN